MPKGFPPSVFVSSTCYDLNQIRTDLREFLGKLGVEPLLSEHTTFPVNPQVNTTANCVNVVKERADIFVLIVGARYGCQDETGTSITNREYLEARAKGIPIYVFVLKSILHMLPVWKNNQQGTFDNVVDTPKLFEFVNSLHGTREHWVYSFEHAQGIMETLRQQLAYLFMDALSWREKLVKSSLPPSLARLSGEALQLVVERPPAWEFNLLAAALDQEINSLQSLKWDLQYGIRVGRFTHLGMRLDVMEWIQTKSKELQSLSRSAESLLSKATNEAFGPPGVAGNPELIVYTARRLAHVYQRSLEWTIECNSVETSDDFVHLLELFSRASTEAFKCFETMAQTIREKTEIAIKATNRGEHASVEVMFKLQAPDFGEFNEELDRLTKKYS